MSAFQKAFKSLLDAYLCQSLSEAEAIEARTIADRPIQATGPRQGRIMGSSQSIPLEIGSSGAIEIGSVVAYDSADGRIISDARPSVIRQREPGARGGSLQGVIGTPHLAIAIYYPDPTNANIRKHELLIHTMLGTDSAQVVDESLTTDTAFGFPTNGAIRSMGPLRRDWEALVKWQGTQANTTDDVGTAGVYRFGSVAEAFVPNVNSLIPCGGEFFGAEMFADTQIPAERTSVATGAITIGSYLNGDGASINYIDLIDYTVTETFTPGKYTSGTINSGTQYYAGGSGPSEFYYKLPNTKSDTPKDSLIYSGTATIFTASFQLDRILTNSGVNEQIDTTSSKSGSIAWNRKHFTVDRGMLSEYTQTDSFDLSANRTTSTGTDASGSAVNSCTETLDSRYLASPVSIQIFPGVSDEGLFVEDYRVGSNSSTAASLSAYPLHVLRGPGNTSTSGVPVEDQELYANNYVDIVTSFTPPDGWTTKVNVQRRKVPWLLSSDRETAVILEENINLDSYDPLNESRLYFHRYAAGSLVERRRIKLSAGYAFSRNTSLIVGTISTGSSVTFQYANTTDDRRSPSYFVGQPVQVTWKPDPTQSAISLAFGTLTSFATAADGFTHSMVVSIDSVESQAWDYGIFAPSSGYAVQSRFYTLLQRLDRISSYGFSGFSLKGASLWAADLVDPNQVNGFDQVDVIARKYSLVIESDGEMSLQRDGNPKMFAMPAPAVPAGASIYQFGVSYLE